jgi:hypothetical protein
MHGVGHREASAKHRDLKLDILKLGEDRRVSIGVAVDVLAKSRGLCLLRQTQLLKRFGMLCQLHCCGSSGDIVVVSRVARNARKGSVE